MPNSIIARFRQFLLRSRTVASPWATLPTTGTQFLEKIGPENFANLWPVYEGLFPGDSTVPLDLALLIEPTVPNITAFVKVQTSRNIRHTPYSITSLQTRGPFPLLCQREDLTPELARIIHDILVARTKASSSMHNDICHSLAYLAYQNLLPPSTQIYQKMPLPVGYVPTWQVQPGLRRLHCAGPYLDAQDFLYILDYADNSQKHQTYEGPPCTPLDAYEGLIRRYPLLAIKRWPLAYKLLSYEALEMLEYVSDQDLAAHFPRHNLAPLLSAGDTETRQKAISVLGRLGTARHSKDLSVPPITSASSI